MATSHLTADPRAAGLAAIIVGHLYRPLQHIRDFGIERYPDDDAPELAPWTNGAIFGAVAAHAHHAIGEDADLGAVRRLYVGVTETVNAMIERYGGLDVERYAQDLLRRDGPHGSSDEADAPETRVGPQGGQRHPHDVYEGLTSIIRRTWALLYPLDAALWPGSPLMEANGVEGFTPQGRAYVFDFQHSTGALLEELDTYNGTLSLSEIPRTLHQFADDTVDVLVPILLLMDTLAERSEAPTLADELTMSTALTRSFHKVDRLFQRAITMWNEHADEWDAVADLVERVEAVSKRALSKRGKTPDPSPAVSNLDPDPEPALPDPLTLAWVVVAVHEHAEALSWAAGAVRESEGGREHVDALRRRLDALGRLLWAIEGHQVTADPQPYLEGAWTIGASPELYADLHASVALMAAVEAALVDPEALVFGHVAPRWAAVADASRAMADRIMTWAEKNHPHARGAA